MVFGYFIWAFRVICKNQKEAHKEFDIIEDEDSLNDFDEDFDEKDKKNEKTLTKTQILDILKKHNCPRKIIEEIESL